MSLFALVWFNLQQRWREYVDRDQLLGEQMRKLWERNDEKSLSRVDIETTWSPPVLREHRNGR